MQARQIEKILFYCLLFFLPTQFGRHFWPSFSYVQGLKIDYLSPTFYLTDLLIFLLFISALINKISLGKPPILKIKPQKSFILVVVIIMIGILFSKSPLVGVYGLIKFFEFLLLGFYVAKSNLNIKTITGVFSIGVIFQGGLAILQFINAGSLDSLMYYFGERTYTGATPGIANVSLEGELILRPYATFPHPNVLAGYLVIVMTIIVFNFQFPTSNFKKMLFGFSLIIGTTALFLTLSRVAILLWLGIIILFLIKKIKENTVKLLTTLFLIGGFGFFLFHSPFISRFLEINFNTQAYVLRKDLAISSLLMFKDNPIFGVGLNNFLINLPFYQKQNINSFFEYLQPVHNVYLLILSQVGFFATLFFAWFLKKTFFKLKEQSPKIKKLLITLLFVILILGMFDHYFLTIQQGQLLMTLVFGLCWAHFLQK